MSPLEIPIKTHPGKEKSASETLSFHRPLSTYIQELALAGFSITNIEEWISDKVSTGGKAKMENRAREEFPLFMMIEAKKKYHRNSILPQRHGDTEITEKNKQALICFTAFSECKSSQKSALSFHDKK